MAQITIWGEDFKKESNTIEEALPNHEKELEELRIMLLQSILEKLTSRNMRSP